MKTKVSSDSVFRVQESRQTVDLPLLPSALRTENRKLKTPSGFTLIELLVVIAIIAILAGLILSTAGYVQKKGAMSRAEAEVAALSAALESYKADMGDYPNGTNGSVSSTAAPTNGNAFLLTNLMPSSGKVYFEFNKGMTNSSGYIVDPFGEQYGYVYPGTMNGSNFFDLWSRSGSTNTNAWIKNW